MALFYNLHDYNTVDHEWHIHESTRLMKEYGRTCVHLQADGDELEAIRQQFTGIPMHSGRVVRWRGEMAAFIAMNLQNPE